MGASAMCAWRTSGALTQAVPCVLGTWHRTAVQALGNLPDMGRQAQRLHPNRAWGEHVGASSLVLGKAPSLSLG